MKCPKCGHEAVERMGGLTIVDTSCARCGTSLLPGATPTQEEHNDGDLPAAPPARQPLRVHVYRLQRGDDRTWVVTKLGPRGVSPMGHIADTTGMEGGGLHFFPDYDLSGRVPASLASAALPAFLSHVAYAAVSRDKLRETTVGAAMEVEITLMGTHGDQLEYIASEIPEVPGLFGMLGCGWPPRELDHEEHLPCD